MNCRGLLAALVLVAWFQTLCLASNSDLATLKKDQTVSDFTVANLYSDSDAKVVGAKFWHVGTRAPVYVLQIETVPQMFMWIDTPTDSNRGLSHSLEHLLIGKGTKGRYLFLLEQMRLSRSAAVTDDDVNSYSFSSGTGMAGFLEQFHGWLDALYRPDFTDSEAEREFYHFGVNYDASTKKRGLVEKGTVYDEMQSGEHHYDYYFALNKLIFGDTNPFAFFSSGVPDEMRNVNSDEIRRFHGEHYRLGPTTGFIFVLDPREDVGAFLQRISEEFRQVSGARNASAKIAHASGQPKYPIHPSRDTEVKIYPFPSTSETDSGQVRFGWKPAQANSQTDLRLLQLLFRALADGDKSVLYKSLVDSKTRELDSGATSVGSQVFLRNSSFFPTCFIDLSGIPGTRINVDTLNRLRSRIHATLEEISRYPDNSPVLVAFNQLAMSYAQGWRRSQKVWIKSAPRFGLDNKMDWKEHLDYLDMDPSFVRSISDEPIWANVGKQMQSGQNVWRDVILRFHLLDTPYGTASTPSPQLLEERERARQSRIEAKTGQLMASFGLNDEQRALARFEQDELAKTKEIDKLAAQVVSPRFTEHPPLTLDDEVRYKQVRVESVPLIATFFDRAPTIDLGLSFDLRQIPRKYYKYLPILPRCLDSLGLKATEQITPYSDLLAQTDREINDFSIRYEQHTVSHRADLNFRASATGPDEFRGALALIRRMIDFNYLDLSNADRLRDLVEKRIWQDDAFLKGDDSYWFMNPSYAVRYQDDPLYLALSSAYTRAHWDSRLKWLLHKPVDANQIKQLGDFAERILSDSSALTAKELSEKLSRSEAKGLERELLDYWARNVPAFPEFQLLTGLRRLTGEVQEDLRTGPASTIRDLRELQTLVLNRRTLNIDLTLDPALFDKVQTILADFLRTLPAHALPAARINSQSIPSKISLMQNVEKRYGPSEDDYPLYVAVEDPRSTTASLVFYADFPGYSEVDRKSLLQVLSSKLISGGGPHSLFMKSWEDGLAYSTSVASDPGYRFIRFYADRVPDIPSLVELINSIAEGIPSIRDQSLVDYALQQTFSLPRSMSTFSERGRGLANDIRDGNEPEKIRRFSTALLKLRADQNLLSELTHEGLESISPLLIKEEFKSQQRQARLLFFFVGPHRMLVDAEKRLPIPRLLILYASDFWLDSLDGHDKVVANKAQ
jgi:Zn-dependent M16 (insulinase) family peptidase